MFIGLPEAMSNKSNETLAISHFYGMEICSITIVHSRESSSLGQARGAEVRADGNRNLEAVREQRKNRRQRDAGWMKRITFGWPTIRPEPRSLASHNPVPG